MTNEYECLAGGGIAATEQVHTGVTRALTTQQDDEGLLVETRNVGCTHAYVHMHAYQVMLFTYTDKDGYVPPCDKADGSGGGGGLTTGGGGPFSYLGEAVTNMPRKAAISSLETTTKTTVPGGVGGVGGGGARVGVSETAAVIQTHLAREDKLKVRKAPCDLA